MVFQPKLMPRCSVGSNPHREIPYDFADRYAEIGWRVEFHYWISKNLAKQWIDQCGGDQLRQARKDWLAANPRKNGGSGHRVRDRSTIPGQLRPWRTCPDDFREVYLRMGWDGIQEHYRAGWPRIARWIDECGGEELIAARREEVRRRGNVRLHCGHIKGWSAARLEEHHRRLQG